MQETGDLRECISSSESLNALDIKPVRRAVILAAGRGRRLGSDTPKCLLVVGRRTLIERQVRALAAVGVRHVTVVVGYRQDLVRAECARLHALVGLAFDFIQNPDFAHTNTAYSLYLARQAVLNDDFFYLHGDVLFAPDLMQILGAAPVANALLVEVKPCGGEEVKVITEGKRIVRIGKLLPSSASLGEFMGVARFSGEIGQVFSTALETLADANGRNEFFEVALDRIAGEVGLTAITTEGLPVIEIDFPEDLARAASVIVPRIEAGVRGQKHSRIGPPHA